MGMKGSEIEKFIQDAFPDAEIEMKDLAGDDNHWSATVKSSIPSIAAISASASNVTARPSRRTGGPPSPQSPPAP